MDFRLMHQISHGTTRFTGTPKLTSFPIGSNSTPGLIANSLFKIYTPVYGEKSSNIETKVVKKIENEEVKDQKGSGIPKEEVGIAEPLKRKLEEDIFQKMLHPTFKVSKLDPKIKKEKRLLPDTAGSGTSASKNNKETKKFYKF